VARQATARGWEVIALRGSAELDIRDSDAVAAAFERFRPDRVIHTAYRQSDRSVTFDGAVNVATAAARVHARLVHVSSDVVFSGRHHRPYRENDPVDPITEYGRAKADAERAVAERAPGAAIVRTSLLLPGPYVPAALEPTYAFYDDEFRCPVAVEDVAGALIEVAHLPVVGPLHVAGADAISRYDLACLIAAAHGKPVGQVPRTTGAAEAGRPADCRLDCTEARRMLRTRLRGARELFR
jgi:dTDP-4-dehydrorhamnose reductase